MRQKAVQQNVLVIKNDSEKCDHLEGAGSFLCHVRISFVKLFHLFGEYYAMMNYNLMKSIVCSIHRIICLTRTPTSILPPVKRKRTWYQFEVYVGSRLTRVPRFRRRLTHITQLIQFLILLTINLQRLTVPKAAIRLLYRGRNPVCRKSIPAFYDRSYGRKQR